MEDKRLPTDDNGASCPAPEAQPPMSDEPPIPDAEDLPGTPRPAKDRDNRGA